MPANSAEKSGYLILIIEDLPEMRLLKREYLEKYGYRVIEAEDGKAGVEAAIRERPQLILMNNMMPVMNGFEATRLIRRQPELKSVPILMNSACPQETTREVAILAGCNDYMEEPCSPRILVQKVKQHLKDDPNE